MKKEPGSKMFKKRRLTLMVGESGSGKSTVARALVSADTYKQTVRVNRDSIRKMLFENWNAKYEPLVEKLEFEAASSALGAGFNIVVDDLNINPKVKKQWENFAAGQGAEFVLHEISEPLDVCVYRDSQRKGRDRVGRSVITKQFIRNGRPEVFKDVLTVLVDIDGTLANHEGVRNAYDESRVIHDDVYPVVAHWVRMLYVADPGPKYQVLIVSGRHENCGPDTEDWLSRHVIPYDGLLMRNRGDNRSDVVVKQELLDLILKYVRKENIAFVIDHRPRVIAMWKANGLSVIPARGQVEDF
jgi:predicted kinase